MLTRTAASSPRLGQSLIVCGEDDDALREEGFRLAAEWLCQSPAPPCRRCSACQKTLSGQHVDVTWIDEGTDGIIKTAACRALRQDSRLRPFDGEGKVYIIRYAENLNPPAQNALLTLLEEPPVYLRVMLLCQNIGRLLPTVRSRCTLRRLCPSEEAAPETRHSEQAERYLAALSSDWERASVAFSWDKLSRTELTAILSTLLRLLLREAAETDFQNVQYCTERADRISECIDSLQKNASVGSVCGVLAL